MENKMKGVKCFIMFENIVSIVGIVVSIIKTIVSIIDIIQSALKDKHKKSNRPSQG
jgi:uncharacterized metal-binding protein